MYILMSICNNKLSFNDDDQLHQIAVACGMKSEIDKLKVIVYVHVYALFSLCIILF